MSFWKIGHRGACGYAPENTLLSMRKALDLGVDGVEFDIQLSLDGHPVVIHDDTLERTTNGKGLVADYTLKELQALDAGMGEKIPALSQVLDCIDRKCRAFIELKAPGATQAVAECVAHYVSHKDWSYEQLYICAFDHTHIAHIRQLNPAIRTCALLVGIPVTLAQIAQEAGAWSINPAIDHLNQALVDDAHWRGLKLLTWTANSQHAIAKARALGVDGIISNYPDRL